MKKILTLTLILAYSSSLKSSSFSYFLLTLSIVDEQEQTSRGYIYARMDRLHLDSVSNTPYLKKTFKQNMLFWNEYDSTFSEVDSFLYFEDQIKYVYTDLLDSAGQKDTTYHLTNGTMLPYKSIRRIIIEEMKIAEIEDEIINRLRISDTAWMMRSPISVATFSSLYHSYQIFVHETSPDSKRILKRLKIKQNQLNKLNTIDEIASQDSIKSAKLNEELCELIQQITTLKVIVLQREELRRSQDSN